ncbi:MAG: hypothetical protein ABIJ91_02105 [Candidatus Kuenenbacteria bacterium]
MKFIPSNNNLINHEEKEQLKKWYIIIWLKEGKYLDLWSINHVLFGGVLSGIFILAHSALNLALMISILFMIGWEFYEFAKGIHEPFGNKIFDVITGVAGFFLIRYLSSIYSPKNIFLIVLFLFLLLEAWGCYAYHKKGINFI